MMAGLIFKLSLILWVAAAAALGVVRARPYAPTELRAYLSAPQGCPAPCLMGVRPGDTRLDHAWALLEAHPWVAEVRLDDYDPYRVYWRWSGQQPPLFDGARDGLLVRNNFNQVVAMRVVTRIPFASVWFEIAASDARLPIEAGALHTLDLLDPNPQTLNFITCPAHARQFWGARVILNYASGYVGLSNEQVGYYNPRFRSCR